MEPLVLKTRKELEAEKASVKEKTKLTLKRTKRDGTEIGFDTSGLIVASNVVNDIQIGDTKFQVKKQTCFRVKISPTADATFINALLGTK